MKQIGNLAVICARRPEVLLQVHGGQVAVHVGAGPNRTTLLAQWDDEAQIDGIIWQIQR